MKDRFDLEEAMGDMAQTPNDIETIIYAIGDCPIKHTEDELLNMLIGIKQLHDTRYQKMWNTFEELVSNGTISNKSANKVKMPPYDDGTMRMEVTDSEGSVEEKG
jgi:hypothetical protein